MSLGQARPRGPRAAGRQGEGQFAREPHQQALAITAGAGCRGRGSGL